MFKKVDRKASRQKKQMSIRNKISGTPERPRLSVFRSNTNIFAQLIDDVNGVTLVSASTIDKALKGSIANGGNVEAAKAIGKAIAERAKEKGINAIVFDRSGYKYTGRVAALAEAAREAGGFHLLNREDNQYQEKLLKISRVSKTTKGGRTISFSVLAAVGDGEGKIGLGLGKANGVPDAIRKAIAAAKKNIVKISLKNNTIPHEITGRWGATTLWMAPAYEGTGVIAGSASREILELVGVHDILTKIKGSRNKHNVARATVEALKLLRTAEEIAALRGLEVKDILS